ncbi:hypothetical protein [Bacillus arachidis]|uniref:dTDP-4-amino-4,6-dideoxygalactose transaminase n=1 Tax=Bacillus arachidis TaxID=2819290 RepID=A0ABS3NYK5_9BACI|nr:hypothetical protein [Bacillus arachidis]MBO1626024.1 hypothetical protein [Bacillus arachidis]
MAQREIGGFFELELLKKQEYHRNALRLNKARSALYYLLKSKQIKKIYLPYYMCSCILEPVTALKLDCELYRIDEKFYPIFNKTIGEKESFLYINYFGICSEIVSKVVTNFNNVIIDNTQAFFDFPIFRIDTIYSPRKFFGVSDGGYLYTTMKIKDEFEKDQSYNRFEFLAKRIDSSASDSYPLFQENEELLANETIKQMSPLTKRILSSIDYEAAKNNRNDNFQYLHNELQVINQLPLNIHHLNGPMIYPLFIHKKGVREFLIKEYIYVATYWKEVLDYTEKDWFEHQLTRYLVPLPIDQRYGIDDMKYIIQTLKKIVSFNPKSSR